MAGPSRIPGFNFLPAALRASISAQALSYSSSIALNISGNSLDSTVRIFLSFTFGRTTLTVGLLLIYSAIFTR